MRRQACVPIILWNCSLTPEPRILTCADVRNCSVTGLLELFITGFDFRFSKQAAAALTMNNNINNNIWDAIEAEAQELNRCEYTIVFFCKFVVLYYSCFFFFAGWSILLEEQEQQQQHVFKLPDVPTDEYLSNLPKDSITFNCVICMESVPMNTVYTLNCDHQLCCGCARRLITKYCPFCRNDISSTQLTKRKIEEVERKFSQLEEDEELARKLHAELNSEDNNDDDDDVVVLRTTRTTTTTIETKRSKRTKKGEDSDDEWTPVVQFLA